MKTVIFKEYMTYEDIVIGRQRGLSKIWGAKIPEDKDLIRLCALPAIEISQFHEELFLVTKELGKTQWVGEAPCLDHTLQVTKMSCKDSGYFDVECMIKDSNGNPTGAIIFAHIPPMMAEVLDGARCNVLGELEFEQ